MTNEQLYLAECVTDYLSTHDWLNNFDKLTLASLRADFVCKKSEIGAYECCVKTAHGYCCDTCLQSELHELWRVGVSTTGSCCGHGKKQAYIQVTSKDVQKMHELGYVRLPDDGSSDGIETYCFKPKTYLPIFETAGQRREEGM